MRKKLLLVVPITLITLSLGSIIGYRQYRISQLNAKLEEAIGKDAGYTETILKLESDSSKMTFAEVFDLCNKSIEARTSLIVELRGIYPSVDYELKQPLIAFLNSENDVIRAKREFYRKQLELSSSIHSFNEQVANRPTSYYGWDFHFERLKRMARDMSKAAQETDDSAASFLDIYQKTLKVEGGVAKAASKAGVRFEPAFQRYEQGNKKSAEETRQLARQFLSGKKEDKS